MPAHRIASSDKEELAIALLKNGESMEVIKNMLGYKTLKSVRDLLGRHGLRAEQRCRWVILPADRGVTDVIKPDDWRAEIPDEDAR